MLSGLLPLGPPASPRVKKLSHTCLETRFVIQLTPLTYQVSEVTLRLEEGKEVITSDTANEQPGCSVQKEHDAEGHLSCFQLLLFHLAGALRSDDIC